MYDTIQRELRERACERVMSRDTPPDRQRVHNAGAQHRALHSFKAAGSSLLLLLFSQTRARACQSPVLAVHHYSLLQARQLFCFNFGQIPGITIRGKFCVAAKSLLLSTIFPQPPFLRTGQFYGLVLG